MEKVNAEEAKIILLEETQKFLEENQEEIAKRVEERLRKLAEGQSEEKLS